MDIEELLGSIYPLPLDGGFHFRTFLVCKFCNLVLPHVFGELGKPFYNSVVSTFASQIVNGESPTVTGDGDLNLLHSHEVSKIIWDKIETGFSGTYRPEGQPIKVCLLYTSDAADE